MANIPTEKRQCWECFRRRLVCDFGQPCCKKCIKNGVECPGYSEQKPLKWLDPGKVTSKRRKHKRQDIGQKGKDRDNSNVPKSSKTPFRSSRYSSEERAGLNEEADPAMAALVRLSLRENKIRDSEVDAEGESDVEEVPRRLYESWGYDEIPRFELTDETVDIVHAIQYYNTQVYPDLVDSMQLVRNPYIIVFPLKALPYLPPSIHHTMTCYAISHRLHQLQSKEDRVALSNAWSRIYQHRGRAIKDISQSLLKEETRASPATITGVLLLLANEIQQPLSGNWRQHAHGLYRMFMMRGGYKNIYEQTPYLRAALVLFIILEVTANTTSPATDQFAPSSPSLLVSHITETYETIFPHILCPRSLFLDVATINSIRGQTLLPEFVNDSSRDAAQQVLARIESFSPKDWAIENTADNATFRDEWETIGSIYQSAIAIYCINSLQSLGALDKTSKLDASRFFHGETVFKLIKKGIGSQHLRKMMFWPTVMSGFEAKNRGLATKEMVLEQLQFLSQDLGTSTPLHAMTVLKKFWDSGKTTWDECFDSPYVLNM